MLSLMGFEIFDKDIKNLDFKNNRVINTINPHSYCMTKKDKDFEYVLKNSDVVLPDGIGIVWAAKVLKRKRITKIAGYDLFNFLMNHLNKSGGSCFFLGASQNTLELIENKAKEEFPNVKVYTYSPPYKNVFSEEDTNTMIEKINKVKPTVLFVGMTAPKQEKWSFTNRDKLQVDTICSIGAVFDFYAGTVQRSSKFWIKLGLEWLPRFLKEPKRLAERNLVSTPKFIFEVLRYKLIRRTT